MSRLFYHLLAYGSLLMGVNLSGCKAPEDIAPTNQTTTLKDTTQRPLIIPPKPVPKLDSFFTSPACDSLVAVAFGFYKAPQTQESVGKVVAFNAQAADNYPDIFNDFPEARLPFKNGDVTNLIKLATLLDTQKTPKLQFVDPVDSLKKVVLETKALLAIIEDYQKKQMTPDEKALTLLLYQSQGYHAFAQKISRIEGTEKWGLAAGVFMPTGLLKDFNLSAIYQITSHELGHATHLNTAFNADGTLKPTPSTFKLETEADSIGFVRERTQNRRITGSVYAALNAKARPDDYEMVKQQPITTFTQAAKFNIPNATHNHAVVRCVHAQMYNLVSVAQFNKNTEEVLNPKGGRLATPTNPFSCLPVGKYIFK